MTATRRKRAPWVIWAGDDQLTCLRCGAVIDLPTPVPPRVFVGLCRKAERDHAGCLDPEEGELELALDRVAERGLD
jgi:hypothetical protein